MRYFLILAYLLAVSTTQAQTSGLVAHWDFNGNVNDQSGNGLNGNAFNITYTNGSGGSPNTAAVFNGASSYVFAPYKSVLNSSTYTICATVKVNAFNTNACQESVIMATGMFPATGGISLTTGDNPFDNDDCNNYDTSKNIFRCSAGSAYINPTTWQYTPTARTGRWYNIVGVFDGTNYKFYVDGILMKTAPKLSGGYSGNTNRPVYIGRNPSISSGVYAYWFNGEIDDLKIYNRVLSDSERNVCCTPSSNIAFDDVFVDTLLCRGSFFNLAFSTSKSYNSGNVFSAELSDATGSFISPTIVGTLTSQSGGTIPCTIPASTPAGNKYRIRVVSSSPYDESADNGTDIRIVSNITPTVSISASPGINVGPNVPITFTATPNNSGANPSYQWYKNGIAIQGATGDAYTGINGADFFSGDNIYVVLTSKLPCATLESANSNTLTTNVNVSVSTVNKLESIIIAPNPNNGQFYIQGTASVDKSISICILNMVGQTIHQEIVKPIGRQINHQVNLNSELAAGTYILQLQTGEEVKTLRLNIR